MTSNLTLNAQNFADKTYYLIDSLDLNKISNEDSLVIESSLKIYHQAKDDTSKVNAINSIYENISHDSWVRYQDFQLKLITELLEKKLSLSIVRLLKIEQSAILSYVGFSNHKQGRLSVALKFYHNSLKIREEINDLKGIANSYNSIGEICYEQGNLSQCLEYYDKSLIISEKTNDSWSIIYVCNKIGFVYKEQGENSQAVKFFKKGLEVGLDTENKREIANSYINIGSVQEQSFSLSLDFYNKSLLLNEEIGNKSGISRSLNYLGIFYEDKGDFISALKSFNKSLRLNEELKNKNGIIISEINIGRVLMKKGDLKIAEEKVEKALNMAKDLGNINLIQSATIRLTEIYQKQGKGLKALEMYKLHIQMKDSLNNEATQKATAQQQAKYEYEKQKAIDDVEHDKLLAIEQEDKAKQKVITIAIGVGLGLVVVFLLFVFNRLQVTKKQKIVIEQQRDEVEVAHKEIRDSINYAERIQRSFLATDELLNNNLKDYFVFYQPKDVVSGDFYWAGKLANNQFAVVNADSTGHGVPGAIMSILNISSIEKAIDNKLVKPADIFNHTRNTIIERLSKDGSEEGGKDGMDASIISFDFENNKFSYTAAQNPIWIIRNNEIIEIKGEKMPIGKHDNDTVPFVGGEFETQKGDIVYTITDGFQDQFGGKKGKKFKLRPFKDYLISITHLPMHEQKEKLTETFTNWKGELEQVDDVCAIGVKI